MLNYGGFNFILMEAVNSVILPRVYTADSETITQAGPPLPKSNFHVIFKKSNESHDGT